ncbi:MAG: GNAT family N-acetyltransferase [Candidatus Acidiferrales bacterium]
MSREAEPGLYFEPLADHDRAAFSCGVEALDNYLRQQVKQDIRKRSAVAFVLTNDGKTIVGYYTLSQFSVNLGTLPPEVAAKLPRYPDLPATRLGRLALSSAYRGRQLGEALLMDALKRALGGSRHIASALVVVDAKDEGAANFYKKYGFRDLPRVANRFFVPMQSVEEIFAGES